MLLDQAQIGACWPSWATFGLVAGGFSDSRAAEAAIREMADSSTFGERLGNRGWTFWSRGCSTLNGYLTDEYKASIRNSIMVQKTTSIVFDPSIWLAAC